MRLHGVQRNRSWTATKLVDTAADIRWQDLIGTRGAVFLSVAASDVPESGEARLRTEVYSAGDRWLYPLSKSCLMALVIAVAWPFMVCRAVASISPL